MSTQKKRKFSSSINVNLQAKKNKLRFINDVDITGTMLQMLRKRGPLKTCWPSEIPRKLLSWKSLTKPQQKEVMQQTRRVAFDLAGKGVITVLQKMQEVDFQLLKEIRGPIRLRILEGKKWTWVVSANFQLNDGVPTKFILRHLINSCKHEYQV